MDMLDDEEKPLVQKRLISLLSPLTSAGARHVYFVSAREALQARISHDTLALRESGVPRVEEDLKEVLAIKRGRLKLARPASALQESVRAARASIADNRALREVSLLLDEQSAVVSQLLSELALS
jgi:hypothetical protein